MNKIIFSIVIPTYNSKNTILKCIESCINQSYKEFEIIVVDDCSSDDTIEIIKEYKVKNNIDNIIIEKLNVNGGASVARNIGIKIARGTYVALLDSDDYFHPNKLEIISKLLLLNNNIDLIGHDYYIETEDEISFANINIKNIELKKIACCSLLLKNFAVTPSIVFKQEINTLFNEKMRYTEDHEFFLRVCHSNFKIYYLDMKLVGLNRAVLTSGGQSSNNFKMRLGEIQMYVDLYKLNYLYIFISPFLVIFSMSKHILRMVKNFLNV